MRICSIVMNHGLYVKLHALLCIIYVNEWWRVVDVLTSCSSLNHNLNHDNYNLRYHVP